MGQPETIAEAEKALANVRDSALALMSIAEVLDGDRRFIVQQIAWSIQNELDVVLESLRQREAQMPPAVARSDRATVVQLTPKDSRDAKPDT